jgi:hypothetical protein
MDNLINRINEETGNSLPTITEHIGISEPADEKPFEPYTDITGTRKIPQYTLEELAEMKIDYENRENNKEHDPVRARLYAQISSSGQNLSNEQRYGSSVMSNTLK